MVACHPTCPPPSVPWAMMTSAPHSPRPDRLGHASRHEGDLAARLMCTGDIGPYVLLRSRPRQRDHRRPQGKCRRITILLHVEDQEIQPERPVGPFADRRRRVSNLLRPEVMTTHCAETARVGDGGDERRCIDRPHAAEHNRMLDAQEVADGRSDHRFLPRPVCTREIRRTPTLVPRFRSSWYIAALSHTNFGNKGALASL
jgi:hypothetical protein